VTVVGAAPDKLRIEKKLTTPLPQTFTAFTSCQKLTLGTPVPPAWSPAGDARGYVLRAGSLDLRDAPRGTVVATPRALDVMPAPNAQFWVKKEELGL
jgi:hypothetical protein